MAGYSTIADVKRKDGSFDLTPLFIGSQGTLGIISEMIMRTEFKSVRTSAAVLTFSDSGAARDALDDLAKLNPAVLEYYDAAIFDMASASGHVYPFYAEATEAFEPKAVILLVVDNFNDHQRSKIVKKLVKQYEKDDTVKITTAEGDEAEDLMAIHAACHYVQYPDQTAELSPAIFGGFHIPADQLETFINDLAKLAEKEHISLPIAGHAITNVYSVYPVMSLSKVSDKQRIFKLLDALSKLVYTHRGTMVAEGGEGRLKARSIYPELDEKVVEMYEAIRKVCDPLNTLNPGVKQVNDLKTLAKELRSSADVGHTARLGL